MWKCVYCGKESNSPFDFVPAWHYRGLKCFMNNECQPPTEEAEAMSKSRITVVIR